MLTSLPHNGILIIFKEKQHWYFWCLELSTIWKCIFTMWSIHSEVWLHFLRCSSQGQSFLSWRKLSLPKYNLQESEKAKRLGVLESTLPVLDTWRQTPERSLGLLWRNLCQYKLLLWIGAGLRAKGRSSACQNLPRDREPFYLGESGTSSFVCTQSAILWPKNWAVFVCSKCLVFLRSYEKQKYGGGKIYQRFLKSMTKREKKKKKKCKGTPYNSCETCSN